MAIRHRRTGGEDEESAASRPVQGSKDDSFRVGSRSAQEGELDHGPNTDQLRSHHGGRGCRCYRVVTI